MLFFLFKKNFGFSQSINRMSVFAWFDDLIEHLFVERFVSWLAHEPGCEVRQRLHSLANTAMPLMVDKQMRPLTISLNNLAVLNCKFLFPAQHFE